MRARRQQSNYNRYRKYNQRRGGFYYTCPYCGANLDAGERCDCTASNEVNVFTSNKVTKEEAVGYERN